MTTEPDAPEVAVATFEDPVTAQAVAGRLRESGLHARVVELASLDAGFARSSAPRIPVVVPSAQGDAARAQLEAFADEASDSIDWDQVEVGTRADDLPLGQPGRVPWPARIAAIVVVLALLAMLGLFVMMLLPR